MAADLTLYAKVLGEPALGVWCERCLLPAAFTIDIGLFTDTGQLIGVAGTFTHCIDCDSGQGVATDEEDQSRAHL